MKQKAAPPALPPIYCFVCGKKMQACSAEEGWLAGWCLACDVMEIRQPTPYVNRTRTVTSTTWGNEILHIDHSVEHWPSPA